MGEREWKIGDVALVGGDAAGSILGRVAYVIDIDDDNSEGAEALLYVQGYPPSEKWFALLKNLEPLDRHATRQDRDRRERIATAVFAAREPTKQDSARYAAMAEDAVLAADALIAALKGTITKLKRSRRR